MNSRRLMCCPQSEGCSLPHRGRKYRVVHHSKIDRRMVEMGPFRQIDPPPTLSACPLRSDRVRTFAPQRFDAVCHKPTHPVQQKSPYSITSSAMASTLGGIVRPSALAVLRFITNSNFVDWSTGIS